MTKMMKLVMPVLVLTVVGCGGSGRPAVHPTRGQLWIGSKPAIHARIALQPVGEGKENLPHPVGIVGEDGSFRLTSFDAADGAPAGEYAVTVTQYLAAGKRGSDETTPVNYLPARYAKAETSRLRVTIQPGTNELPPFRLEVR
jgi:hypothetical protein